MSLSPTILALDCSFAGLSLALQTPAQTYAFTTATPRSSDILPVELQQLLVKAEVTPALVQKVVVAVGPGSFTGIRLGLAVAEALKVINPAIAIHGVSTLRSLAVQVVAEHTPQDDFTLVLDAAGGQFYTQSFNGTGQPLTEAVCTTELLQHGRLFAQSGLMLEGATPLATLDARHMLALVEHGKGLLPPRPVYLKPLTYKKAY